MKSGSQCQNLPSRYLTPVSRAAINTKYEMFLTIILLPIKHLNNGDNNCVCLHRVYVEIRYVKACITFFTCIHMHVYVFCIIAFIYYSYLVNVIINENLRHYFKLNFLLKVEFCPFPYNWFFYLIYSPYIPHPGSENH